MKAKYETLPDATGGQFGSEYVTVDPTQVMPAVKGFQELLNDGNLKTCILSFAEVEAHGDDNPAKTITQNCIDTIDQTIGDRVNGQLYVDSEVVADKLQGRTQDMLLSRTNIAETSAHKVFFVALIGGAARIRVAVKPFMREEAITPVAPGASTGSLTAEWVNTLMARKRGFGAFTPLGFVVTGRGGYMLTERRDGFDSMDNADWTEVLQNPDHHADMLKDLLKVGPLLAKLHDAGGFHGDTQLKNFVLGEGGEIDFIDWEAANWIEPPLWGRNTDTQQNEFWGRKESRDLTVLFASLARSVADKGVGFLQGLTFETQWDFFRQYIVTPYMNERLRLLDEGQHPDPEQAIIHLGELEQRIQKYVIDGELYTTLARARNRF